MAALVRMPGSCWTAREARRMRGSTEIVQTALMYYNVLTGMEGRHGAGNWIGCGQPDPADNDG
jgi:hypothetical protein